MSNKPKWYVQKDDNLLGPFSNTELRQMASNGELQPDDLINRSDMDKWIKAKRAKGLFNEAQLTNESSSQHDVLTILNQVSDPLNKESVNTSTLSEEPSPKNENIDIISTLKKALKSPNNQRAQKTSFDDKKSKKLILYIFLAICGIGILTDSSESKPRKYVDPFEQAEYIPEIIEERIKYSVDNGSLRDALNRGDFVIRLKDARWGSQVLKPEEKENRIWKGDIIFVFNKNGNLIERYDVTAKPRLADKDIDKFELSIEWRGEGVTNLINLLTSGGFKKSNQISVVFLKESHEERLAPGNYSKNIFDSTDTYNITGDLTNGYTWQMYAQQVTESLLIYGEYRHIEPRKVIGPKKVSGTAVVIYNDIKKVEQYLEQIKKRFGR
jgi:hypothetical protein